MLSDRLKTLPQYLIPKQMLTTCAGMLANVANQSVKNYLIRSFIHQYQVDMEESIKKKPEDFSTFNDFFIRHLKPGIRPISDADIVSPVDGIISEFGAIKEGQIFQAKGRYYNVDDLLSCDSSLSQQFKHGRFATLYLAPKNYHRIHMPIDAVLKQMIFSPGKLFSVQPSTVRVIPQLFSKNQRLSVFFDTPLGLMAMVLVGATIVGTIGTSWAGDIIRSKHKQFFNYSDKSICLNKGDEMGYFKLGSTVVLLFANELNNISWDNITPGQSIKFGEKLGFKR